MTDLLTKTNIDDYLMNCIGIDSEDVKCMPNYVKRELVMDDYDLFEEYLGEGYD